MNKQKPYVAIKHIATQKFFADDEENPVDSHYGQYCEEVAAKRLANMYRPSQWEVVISPFQGKWK